jgi:hypothetical protein
VHVNFDLSTNFILLIIDHIFFNIWFFAYFYRYILHYIVSTNRMHFYKVLCNSVKVEISFSKVYR